MVEEFCVAGRGVWDGGMEARSDGAAKGEAAL